MAEKSDTYLAIDLGAGSGRAILGHLGASGLELEEIHRFTNGPVGVGGTLYWDFARLWQEVVHALGLCGRRRIDLAGIGVDTWGVDFGLIGADGRLLGNPFCYRDGITDGMDRRIADAIPRAEFYRLTGMTPAPVATLSQLCGLKQRGAADRLRMARSLLMMPDLFRYFLCGHEGVELTSAGSTLMTNIRTRRWCPRVARSLGIPGRILPPIVTPPTVVGRLHAELAERTGVGRVPVIAVAGHDSLSAAAAAPYADERTAFISCGTWSVAGRTQDRPVTRCEALDAGFVNELGVSSILFARNMTGLYLFENLKRSMDAAGEKLSYPAMVREASQAKPFAAFIDPSAPEFAIAADPAQSVRAYLGRTGQRVPRSRGTVMRMLIEALAASHGAAIRDLGRVTGADIRRVCLVGGGCRNGLLCQMTADACGVDVIAGPAEATAIGNLALQAVATRRLGGVDAIRELVRLSFRPRTYRPGATDAWERHAQKWHDRE